MQKLLPSLEDFNLAYNNISLIPPSFFAHLPPSLKSLDLKGNEFVCDCDLQPFVIWVLENAHLVNLINYRFYMCQGPPINYTDSVVDVVTQLDCDVTTTTSHATTTAPSNGKYARPSLIIVFVSLFLVVVISTVVYRFRSRNFRRLTSTSMGAPIVANRATNDASCCLVFKCTRSQSEPNNAQDYEEAQCEEQLMTENTDEQPSAV